MMKIEKKKFNYENKKYLKMLNDLDKNFYNKFIIFVKKYLRNKQASFLEVGCGNGNVLVELAKDGYNNIFGCEISSLFLKDAWKRGLKNLFLYNGKVLPFKRNVFRVVGSFGVLEHVDNPEVFLSEQIRVVEKSGIIIVACPNFLSPLFPFPHPRLNKFSKRIINIPKIFSKLIFKRCDFEKVKPIIRKDFQPDDDMVVVTNLIDIELFFRQNNCKIIYSAGFLNRSNFLIRIIESVPYIKYFFPSCFLVAEKQ